jgi:guanine deaminase
MKELGNLAVTHSLPIQSHMSENFGEIQWVKELHPELESYARVYEEYGLLTDKTVMAHCIHMTGEERELLLKNKVLPCVYL